MNSEAKIAGMNTEWENGEMKVILSGTWKTGCGAPSFDSLFEDPRAGDELERLSFDLAAVEEWDSILMTFLVTALEYCRSRQIEFLQSSLPSDIQNLLELSQAVPEKETGTHQKAASLLQRIGEWGFSFHDEFMEIVNFTGECGLSVFNLLRGRATLRWRDFFLLVQEVGANALPIVTLISFLVGLIISFLGAVVLTRFGADTYVSYLIGYGMLRENGALMTGIVMAGRTGAAFAAQIGSMKVSEEIDALKTLGISPIDFIVLPRILALFFMFPLLVIYADFIGVVSGMVISNALLNISFSIFLNGMKVAVHTSDFFLGVGKGVVFGVLVAVTGCLRGMQSGKSADAVGMATTSAVVTGITLIIFFDAVIDWIAALYDI